MKATPWSTNIWVYAALALIALPLRTHAHRYDVWEKDYTVQALLGGARFKNLEFDVEESDQTEATDFSTIPMLGGAWGTLPIGDRFQYGLEASFLIGFRARDLEYLVISSGLRAKVSISLWVYDLAGGPYINLFLDKAKTVRLYAAGGPLLMHVDYDADKELEDDTTEEAGKSAGAVGLYARGGIEFRTQECGTFGLGVRATYADIDFSDVGGTADLQGFAAFVTYTAGF